MRNFGELVHAGPEPAPVASVPVLSARIVGYEEVRDIRPEPDPIHPGRIKGLTPGETRYRLLLALPDGTRGTADVSPELFRAYHTLLGAPRKTG